MEKNKPIRKLKLTKETLRSLEEKDLREAAGGVITEGYTCADTGCRSCKSCFGC
jgi:hypothetical protein